MLTKQLGGESGSGEASGDWASVCGVCVGECVCMCLCWLGKKAVTVTNGESLTSGCVPVTNCGGFLS